MSLYFNSHTKRQLQHLLAAMPQALLLTGEVGSGTYTTATYLAGDTLAAVIAPLDKTEAVNNESGTISVKRIRELYEQARGKSLTKRTFIIDNADKMSQSAQNAFLKLLEEPSSSVQFILTTHNESALLPTILSRVEKLHILPLSEEQSSELAHTLQLRGSKLQQALFVAAGRPAELARLAADTQYFETKASTMAAAKIFIMGSPLDKVGVAFTYATNRDQALALLTACRAILLHTNRRNPSLDTVKLLSKLLCASDAISANGNVKLHLMATVV